MRRANSNSFSAAKPDMPSTLLPLLHPLPFIFCPQSQHSSARSLLRLLWFHPHRIEGCDVSGAIHQMVIRLGGGVSQETTNLRVVVSTDFVFKLGAGAPENPQLGGAIRPYLKPRSESEFASFGFITSPSEGVPSLARAQTMPSKFIDVPLLHRHPRAHLPDAARMPV